MRTIQDPEAKLLGDIFGGDIIVTADAIERKQLRETLDSVLETLSEREALVVRLRYSLDALTEPGQAMTQREVGEVFGVTQGRIHQMQLKALRKLRHPIRSKRLKAFLVLDNPPSPSVH